jgi:hypothetical protein
MMEENPFLRVSQSSKSGYSMKVEELLAFPRFNQHNAEDLIFISLLFRVFFLPLMK